MRRYLCACVGWGRLFVAGLLSCVRSRDRRPLCLKGVKGISVRHGEKQNKARLRNRASKTGSGTNTNEGMPPFSCSAKMCINITLPEINRVTGIIPLSFKLASPFHGPWGRCAHYSPSPSTIAAISARVPTSLASCKRSRCTLSHSSL